MVYIYPATIQRETDGRYSIWFEDLPGCATCGDSLAQAVDMARDAMGGWLDTELKEGESIPQPRSTRNLSLTNGQDAALIDVDLEAYRRRNDQRSVSRTVTLPAWLNTRAAKAGINFSQALQEALFAKLGVAR
jgi:predicted RNase H-like HicB family nuclease